MSELTIPQASPAPAPEVPQKRGMATTALVLGIVGLVLGLVPILGLIAIPLGLLALIFGVVGRKQSRGFALTGIVCGSLAMVLGVVGIVIVGNAVNEFEGDLNEISEDMDAYGACIDQAQTVAEMDLCNE